MYLLAKDTTVILQQLRLLMLALDIVGEQPLRAYIVPSGDAHHSLRMADCDQRRAFLTGFDGSAGVAVVTQSRALLWTDARYFIQAEEQLDENWTLMKEGIDTPLEEWFAHSLPPGSNVGLDSTYYGVLEWEALQASLAGSGLRLTSLNGTNLVDLVWAADRPLCPLDPVRALAVAYTGRSVREKVEEVLQVMEAEGAETLMVTELDEVAWLLNLRGSDLPLAPVFNAYVILTRAPSRLEIFIDPAKIDDIIKAGLESEFLPDGQITVEFYEYGDIFDRVRAHVTERAENRIWISKYCNANLGALIPGPQRLLKLTPISLLKAVKNEVEMEGMRRAHLRDSASIAVFLAWLQEFMASTSTGGGSISENGAVERLNAFKATQANYVSQSFKTISATGPNGAIVHYFPVPATDRNLSLQEMYLLDSGSHYFDGTTDITRTVYFSTPSEYQRECYTRVLKGQIAVATAVFPHGTPGAALDSFGRRFLWQAGKDYGHGTGHGIGAYLNVGEGPQSMAAGYNPDDPGLRANMFLSNEPGYYERDQFGIRLENIVRVRVASVSGVSGFLEFETVSFVPFARNLIKTEMLSVDEIEWLHEYYVATRTMLVDYVRSHADEYGAEHAARALEWIQLETRPLESVP